MADTAPPASARHRKVAVACVVFVGCMFAMAYAAVPLYDWFCRATGFGGATQVAERLPEAGTGGREITVRFDANIAPGLPWRFEPVQSSMRVRIGEPQLAHYRVTNLAGRETSGTASYNVTPTATGLWFNKVMCFCFTEQRLGPYQTDTVTVSFFIDPGIETDRNTLDTDTVTLSYTFFATRRPSRPLAEAPRTTAVR